MLPKPRLCSSIALQMDSSQALARLAEWGQQPMPISAASHDGQVLRLRLEGGEGSVAAAHERLGGEVFDGAYWQQLNEQRLPFFWTRDLYGGSAYLPKAPYWNCQASNCSTGAAHNAG